jgi:hypothetical protein
MRVLHFLYAVVIHQTLADIEKGNQTGELFSKLSKESQIQAKILIEKSGPKNNWHYRSCHFSFSQRILQALALL